MRNFSSFAGLAFVVAMLGVCGGSAVRAGGEVVVLKERFGRRDIGVAEHVAGQLRAAGFDVGLIGAEKACDAGFLRPSEISLYVIPDARSYPAGGLGVLDGYLKAGGKLMVLGGPAFERLAWKYEGKWLDREAMREALEGVGCEKVVFAFDKAEELDGWWRATNDREAGGVLEIVRDGKAGGGKCLRYRTEKLSGWDTWYSREVEALYGAGHTLLCLRARGDGDTGQMAVEIREADGSRWFAVVDLQREWKRYVLGPEEFGYWPDSKTKGVRGHAGDRLNPENAKVICLGLASSHTTAVGAGAHEFWVDELGTAANPFGELGVEEARAPVIETVSPSYKVYESRGRFQLLARRDQGVLRRNVVGDFEGALVLPHARFMGRGLSGRAKWRWIPLMDSLDGPGGERGSVVSMLVYKGRPYKGAAAAVVASVGVNDGRQLKGAALSGAVVRMARRMEDGVFLLEGGAEHFSYWPGEKRVVGAEVINTSAKEVTRKVRVMVTPHRNWEAMFVEEREVTVAAGGTEVVRFEWKPAARIGSSVRTELLRGEEVVDVISHEVGVLSERKAGAEEFVSVRGGDFYLGGEKWYPVGINYWPMYVAGLEEGDYWVHWLAPGAYDPEAVERELGVMSEMGINMLSIQAGKPEHQRNLLDFLRQCEGYGMKVNCFLGGASPLGFREDFVRRYIRAGRLAENPTIFAYDTIWEPGNYVFSESWRPRWDGGWREWIVERYGSIKNAERDWGFAACRVDGRVVSPSSRQFREDGAWRVMVAAYRRFMDDLMSRKWNDATRRLRAIVPRQLISFRQGNTLPHDFTFTATPKHIDFICPEGYAIPLSEDGYNAAGFVTRYVNFTTRGKPIVWSEFGKNVWNRRSMRPDAAIIAEQGRYHDIFYRVVLEAGANGTAPWWWPGGYRAGERSDYGVMNPDGTERPAAELIRKYARLIKKARVYPEGDYALTIDRDAHAGGYWHITFNEGKDGYAAAVAEGRNLRIKTAGTGTTSADCPLVAVGNTAYNGSNPPKYLNAEFNFFRVKDAGGKWVEVRDEAVIKVRGKAPVIASASVGNTQEAEWLAARPGGDDKGVVCLSSTERSQLRFRAPIAKDTPYLHDAVLEEFALAAGIDQETVVEMQMTAKHRASFGEKIRFTLRPE